MLNKQIHIYSVDTSDFYKKRERKIHKKLNKLYIFRNELNNKIKKSDNEDVKDKQNKCLYTINNSIKYFKNKLQRYLNKNENIRTLYHKAINNKNIVSVFESTLTRSLNIKTNELSKDLIIVKTYFYDVLEDIILNGFKFNEEKYVCLTASAGQIRTKKTVFIKEDSLNKIQNIIMCGLTVDKINKLGGVNINKYLAYLALCNSATDLWEDFDIDKCIVVDDMETMVRGYVDYINEKTYSISRVKMKIPIPHTDGCGIILPTTSEKSFMVRLPWVKGLLVPFDFIAFIQEHNKYDKKYGKVKDIYGKEWDLLNDDIQVIFTKSQFKMWAYYNSWEDYCMNFKKHKCQAGICNIEEDDFGRAKLNYQMIQSLTDVTNEELKKITQKTIDDIYYISKDKNTMLKLLGVTSSNTKKNHIQQALELYPSMLADSYIKNILNDTRKKLIKEGKSGKIDIDGVYTFICPDLYAFCEYLILGISTPRGLLKNGEVFCNIYKDKNKLDCLRSPHLWREHGIRNNVVDTDKSKWFITNNLYTSTYDLISKLLQFDVDGDKSLVCADYNFIDIAEKNMENVVPLYYEMKKAKPEIINNENIYKGLKTAYSGGNIGQISNNITKIWNSDEISGDDKKDKIEALNCIKMLCMENNFVIDYAKTLYKIQRPKHIHDLISKHTKSKSPFFFKYAKDKKSNQIKNINNSTMNKLCKMIKNTRLNVNNNIQIGEFNYKILLIKEYDKIDEKITEKYRELDLKKYMSFNTDKDVDNTRYVYNEIRNKLLEVNKDIQYIIYSLVEYLYKEKNAKNKTTLWECFGEELINNIKCNILINYIYCKVCGCLTERKNNKTKYCKICAREINIQKTIENRKNRKLFEIENS